MLSIRPGAIDQGGAVYLWSCTRANLLLSTPNSPLGVLIELTGSFNRLTEIKP